MRNDNLYKIALTQIPSIGPVTARMLVSYCGGVKAVFDASKKELLQIPGIGPKTAKIVSEYRGMELAEQELEFIEKHGIECIFFTDDKYPQRLRNYDDAPTLLYFKGNTDLNHPRIVSIIGTRMASVYGKAICEEIVEELKQYNVMILSGLAYGIDVTAHKKSVESNIPTVGVLGNGMSNIYPPEHTNIANKMMQAGGILTEYTHKALPSREHFPMRNRIVAGMCDALIVIETKKKGGSMITAELANGYNKDVFAVPGRANDKKYGGCNYLIKNHKAQLVESGKDVAGIMRWEELDESKNIQKQLFVELNGKEQIVVDALKAEDEITIDKLSFATQFQPSEVSALLLGLEFKGLVKPLPGKRYILI